MITINDIVFYDKPSSCNQCGFFNSGSTPFFSNPGKGHCTLFDEMHNGYINPPARCAKLFNKAFRFNDGEKLVITKNK